MNTLSQLNQDERSKVRVGSKFGLLEGPMLDFYRSTSASSDLKFKNVVKVTEDAYHCIDKEFMRFQLSRVSSAFTSIIGSLDVFFIHNPELSFRDEVTNQSLIDKAHTDARLFDLFCALEEEVIKGRIKGYGISSNSFSLPVGHPLFLPYQDLATLAEQAATAVGSGGFNHGTNKHHLKAIQFPANVIERTALSDIDVDIHFVDGDSVSKGNGIAQWARQEGIEVMVNRALTAVTSDRIYQLTTSPANTEEHSVEVAYAAVRDQLFDHLSPAEDSTTVVSPEEKAELEELLEACAFLKKLVHDMESQLLEFDNVNHFSKDLQEKILPVLNEKLEGIDEQTFQLLSSYFLHYEHLIRYITEQKAREHVMKTIAATPDLEPVAEAELLQAYSLRYLLTHPLVDTVLVGMNSEQQVEDIDRIQRAVQDNKLKG